MNPAKVIEREIGAPAANRRTGTAPDRMESLLWRLELNHDLAGSGFRYPEYAHAERYQDRLCGLWLAARRFVLE